MPKLNFFNQMGVTRFLFSELSERNRTLTLSALSFSSLIVFRESQLKPLIMIFLLSPILSKLELRHLVLVLSRNLIAFTGIVWFAHAALGSLRILSLQQALIKIVIEWIAIQAVHIWKPPKYIHKQEVVHDGRVKVTFFAVTAFLYCYAFKDFPNRLSTFLLGWDHLNGHVWLTSRTFQEGYLRINSQDFLGIYPKAEISLILSFAKNSIDFQNLVQTILFLEIALAAMSLVVLYELSFGRKTSSGKEALVQIGCTLTTVPILVWFIFYGWTSLILTASALLVVAWQTSYPGEKSSSILTIFISLAAVQSWTLVVPIVVTLFLVKDRRINAKLVIGFAFFIFINIPSFLAIINYNGATQVSEGFKTKSLGMFLIFIGSLVPIIFLNQFQRENLSFNVLITGTYLEATTIWALISLGIELPYYAVKIFFMYLIFICPILLYSLLMLIKSMKVRLVVIGALIGILSSGNVLTSSHNYYNFFSGKQLETSWLSQNIVSNMSNIEKKHVLLFSNYTVDFSVLRSVGKERNSNLFAYDASFVCEKMKLERNLVVLVNPVTPFPKCK